MSGSLQGRRRRSHQGGSDDHRRPAARGDRGRPARRDCSVLGHTQNIRKAVDDGHEAHGAHGHHGACAPRTGRQGSAAGRHDAGGRGRSEAVPAAHRLHGQAGRLHQSDARICRGPAAPNAGATGSPRRRSWSRIRTSRSCPPTRRPRGRASRAAPARATPTSRSSSASTPKPAARCSRRPTPDAARRSCPASACTTRCRCSPTWASRR